MPRPPERCSGQGLTRSTEATGYGVVYYVEHMLQHAGRGGFAGKRVAISGSGNVAQYAALKVIELGATVVSLSDSKGALVAPNDAPFTPEHIEQIAALKVDRRALSDFEHGGRYTYVEGARPWVHAGRVDVALPCATQNEVSRDEAEALVRGGVLVVAEGSNMGCTQEAIDLFEAERRQKGKEAVWYAPGKAANCGGVAVSGLEMAQNSQVSPLLRETSPVSAYAELLTGDAAPGLDVRGSRREAQGHHEERLHGRPRDGAKVRAGQGRRAAEPGRRQQHCRLRQGRAGHARPGRLVVSVDAGVMGVRAQSFGIYQGVWSLLAARQAMRYRGVVAGSSHDDDSHRVLDRLRFASGWETGLCYHESRCLMNRELAAVNEMPEARMKRHAAPTFGTVTSTYISRPLLIMARLL